MLGDRYEMILGPISAIPYNIPVIHFLVGQLPREPLMTNRCHAITKMSHYHFVLLENYKRLVRMGEESWRIKTIGMHELNNLKKQTNFSLKYLKKYNFNFYEPYILFTLHPTTLELTRLKHKLKLWNILKNVK